MNMKQLLTEAATRVQSSTGLNVTTPAGFRGMLGNDESFVQYACSLAEGLNTEHRSDFLKLARNTRVGLLENSMYQLNPHEVLTLPLLRNFYPRLIAKELVNVMPIDKPDVVKGFIKPKFRKFIVAPTDDYSAYTYDFPSITEDISRGPQIGSTTLGGSFTVTVDSTGMFDILTAVGLDAALPSHLEKDLTIVGVYGGGEWTAVSIRTDVDGKFSQAVDTSAGTDIISGHVDYLNGKMVVSSNNGNVDQVQIVAHASLEENSINPGVRFDMEKIRFTAVERKISAEWTTSMEQDVKALFDITIQSELINIIGEQIGLDIDREIITDLFDANDGNPVTHTRDFYKMPDLTYTHGEKPWYETVIVRLNELSAQVYASTNIGAANVLACNPLDCAIYENLNGFEYLGDSVAGGELGYRSATVGAGKWKILSSTVVNKGKTLVKFRSNEMAKAVYVYAPYVPALLTPYPLGNNPSLTVQSRYATKTIRPLGVAVLNVLEGVKP